jgi:hypothetical protein
MQSFLSKVIQNVLSTNKNISDITFILPSKRAGLFLKNELKEQINATTILPKILSIEEFIIQISKLNLIDNITLIFEFYHVYSNNTDHEKLESFEIFTKWAHILLQDFNEIDSNLIDAKHILNYVNDVKRIEKWNLDEKDHTPLTKNYLSFFDQIKIYYTKLLDHLQNKNIGYQGMLYRKAVENTEQFINQNQNQKFVFTGFNALNKAEEYIIHELLLNDIADIFWDNDSLYTKSGNQAGKYFKFYKEHWSYYNSHTFKWEDNNINKNKNVFIYGSPKNIGQIKNVGTILKNLSKNNKLKNSAVILGNEKLLPILLNSIPKEIKEANITMGYELQNIPLAHFFESIFKLHLNKAKFENKNSFYYKDFTNVIEHSVLYNYWKKDEVFNSNLNILIYKKKTIFISPNEIKKLIHNDFELSEIFDILFGHWLNNIETILESFVRMINYLINSENLNTLQKEYLYRFNNVFQQLLNLNKDYGYISNLNTLYQFYKQIVKRENLSFQGEPLKGLQIMGVLESRVLDFENIIITSANEGFLPMGGLQNSFIPLDIKIEKGIPTYREKDSIFAYHFFRLFHRAKNIYILYNTETDDFGSGEQSRFITQLEFAKENNYLKNVTIKKRLVIPNIHSTQVNLKTIQKSNEVIHLLNKIAINGFSPSSLGLYIRNPIDFYMRKVLNLKEYKEVEETIAANTFGTIIHDTLENLYKPLIGNFLTMSNIKKMKGELENEIVVQFKNNYGLKSISSGKNYLTFEIAKQFLLNFLNYEIKELKKNKKIKIVALEQSLTLEYHLKNFSHPIKLKGKIDRIDEVDGVLRIIDYKTGKVESSNLIVKDWENLVSEESNSKSFQVLFYAFMYVKNKNINFNTQNIESGIISFKNLKSGFMRINRSTINQEILDKFLIQLDKLLLEIYNEKIPFTEKIIVRNKF